MYSILALIRAGLAFACLAPCLFAQPTGSQRIHQGSTSSVYLERPSLSDWATCANYSWSATSGGGVWEVTSLGSGLYSLVSGGKALTTNGTAEWSPVATVGYAGWSAQKWTITANGDGTYRIENAGKAVTGDATSGNAVKLATYAGWTTQKWRLFGEDKTGWPTGNWKWVYRGINSSTRLAVKSDSLVINSVFQNVNDGDGMSIGSASNVYVKWTDIINPTANNGIYISNSSQVTIDDCEVINHKRPAAAHSAGIHVASSPNVTIRATILRDLDGNGIYTQGSSTTGLLVTGCTITNTGRWVYSSTAPFHGIYSKAPDATLSNNTISASTDGSAISMRNTGWITGNNLSNAKHSLIAYWPDATAGASAQLTISGNTLTQDNYSYTDNYTQSVLISLNDNNNQHGVTNPYFQTFRIENNGVMRVGSGSSTNHALVAANWPVGSPGFSDARVTGNTMTDQRATKTYFRNQSRFAATSPNTLQ